MPLHPGKPRILLYFFPVLHWANKAYVPGMRDPDGAATMPLGSIIRCATGSPTSCKRAPPFPNLAAPSAGGCSLRVKQPKDAAKRGPRPQTARISCELLDRCSGGGGGAGSPRAPTDHALLSGAIWASSG